MSVHQLSGAEPLDEFAARYRDVLQEQYGSDTDLDEISLEEELENGREFYSLVFRQPLIPGESCGSLNFARILLSYAYPAKPYVYVASASVCEESPDPTRPLLTEDIAELGMVLRSFREWNYFQSENLGWTVSSAPGWTSQGWIPSSLVPGQRINSGVISQDPRNTGILFTEDGDQGLFLVEVHENSKDTLADFAEEYRASVVKEATEREFTVFEMSHATTTIHRGSEALRYTIRRQPSPQSCVEDVVVLQVLIGPESSGQRVISVYGGICEGTSNKLGPARDGMIDSIRP